MESVSKDVKLADAQPLPAVGAGMARVKANAAKSSLHTESESQIQQRLMRWWKYAHKGLGVEDERLLMAFPLQGARTARNGARMKAEGLRAGTPDLMLCVARSKCHGLWIELKKPGGSLSQEQRLALEAIATQGYDAVVCIGFDHAKFTIENYLKQ